MGRLLPAPGGVVVKTSVPNRSERFVPRRRLHVLLDEATAKPLTIVTGPAGVGKTLAVADWTRDGNPPGPVVWISVSEHDREAEQLWATMAQALTNRLGEEALNDIEVTDGIAPMLAAMAENACGTMVLVLDGCEKLSGGTSLASIDHILANHLPGLRLVMLSRHDPALALHRLRLADQLHELRFRDLAFTSDEARVLLERWDVQLTEDSLARLLDATEGWAAALRLAAFSLHRADDPDRRVETFDGLNFLVSEYLWDEVLGTLPVDAREFLQLTAISDRLCGQLGRALSGNPASHEILRLLAREEMLVQELDDSGWYRTHSLLTRVLLRRLRDEHPEREVEGHRRAAQWFEDRGDAVPAMRHAVATRDWDLAGTVAIRCAGSLIFSTERAGFADALSDAPPPFTHDGDELAVAQALAHSLAGDLSGRALLEWAEALLPSIQEPRRALARVALSVAQAFQAHYRGEARLAETATARADSILGTISAMEAHSWAEARPRVAMMQVGATLWAGDPAAACLLSQRCSQGQPPGHPSSFTPTYRLGLLAFMEAVQERHVAEAREMAEQTLAEALPRGRLRSTESQFAWLALGLTGLFGGNIDAARSSLEEVTQSTRLNPNPNIAAMVAIILSRVEMAVGDIPAARRNLAAASRLLAQYPGMLLVACLAAVAQVEVELACGSTDAARAALTRHRPESGPVLDALVLADARVLLAQGEPERARDVVAPLLGTPGASSVAAWLVVSRAEDRLRHDPSRLRRAHARSMSPSVRG